MHSAAKARRLQYSSQYRRCAPHSARTVSGFAGAEAHTLLTLSSVCVEMFACVEMGVYAEMRVCVEMHVCVGMRESSEMRVSV